MNNYTRCFKWVFILVLFASLSNAIEPTCQIDDSIAPGSNQSVVVKMGQNNEIVEPIYMTYEGVRVSARFLSKTVYEPQNVFIMSMDEVSSIHYDVTEETGLMILNKGSIRFQCSFK